jgi:hypothetical protein
MSSTKLDEILGRAYELAAQVLTGETPDAALAEELCSECAELLALIDEDWGSFESPDLIDPEMFELSKKLRGL